MPQLFRLSLLFLILLTIFFALRNLVFNYLFSIKDPILKSLISSTDNIEDCQLIQKEFDHSRPFKRIAWGSSSFYENSISQTQCITNLNMEKSAIILADNIRQICSGLKNLKKALALNPYSSEYNITAIRLDNILKSSLNACGLNESDFSFQVNEQSQSLRMQDFVKNLWPYDTKALYLAALSSLDLNYKNQALQLLHLVENLDPLFSEEQKHFFYSLITKEEELKIAIPTSYFQINNWIDHFYNSRQKDFYQWQNVFEKAFIQALWQFKSDWEKGIIYPKIYAKELEQLLFKDTLRGNERIRSEIDSVIADYCQRERIISCFKLLDSRKSLVRARIKKSLISKDKLPAHTPLAIWQLDDSEELVRFNIKERSIGLDFEEEFLPQLIILENDHIRKSSDNSLISIWASLDNASYQQLDGVETERILFGKRELIVIHLKTNVSAKFLKIRYLSSDESGTFRNKFSNLLQVYGKFKT